MTMNQQPKPHPLAGLGADEILEHATWLRSFARALVGDPQGADDLVQGAFGAVAASPGGIRDLRGYLAGTVRRLAWKERRRRARRSQREMSHAVRTHRTAPPADEALETMEMMRLVFDEVGKLPKAQGRAVSLRFVEQISPDEIARREGTSTSTVRSNLSRGLATLRERLDDRYGDRTGWCAVLAPWSAALPTHLKKVSAPVAASSLASLLLPLMSLKFATIVAAPLVLAALWFGVGDSADVPSLPSLATGTDTAAVELTAVQRASRPATDLSETEVSLLSEDLSESRVAAPDASDPKSTGLYPLTGGFLDRETGEGIPGLVVNLSVLDDSGETVGEILSAVTQVDGSFTVEGQSAPPGKIRVFVWDEIGPARRLVLGPLPMELPLLFSPQITVGPTFRFDCGGLDPSTLSSFEVRARGPQIHAKRPLVTTMRLGEAPWVRFDEPLADSGVLGPWDLRLLSPDGLLVGTCVVNRRVGIEPTVVPVAFEQTGSIHFVLPFDSEEAAPLAVVEVSNAEGFWESILLNASAATLEGDVKHLKPGAYRWSLPVGEVTRSGEIQVTVGDSALVQLELSTSDVRARLGVLDATAAPGVDLSHWMCIVANPQDIGNNFEALPVRAPSLGDDMWTVPLGAVPGDGWLMVLKPEPGYEVDPAAAMIGEAGESATLRVSRSSPQVAVTLVPVDDLTGKRIRFASAVHIDGVKTESVGPGDGFQPILVSAERGTSFLVQKAGYELTEARFEPGRDGSTLKVRLKKGWRSRVTVVHSPDLSFAPGVSVHIDGELAGTTGPDGTLWFSGDGPPRLIEVARDDETFEVALSPFELADRSAGDPTAGYFFLVRERQ